MERTEIEHITTAMQSLRPGASYVISGAGFSTLDWQDDTQQPPTQQEFDAALAAAKIDWAATQHQRQRAAEYPPFADYLDGVVKGDQAQIDAYIAACQAVKAKYPKPE